MSEVPIYLARSWKIDSKKPKKPSLIKINCTNIKYNSSKWKCIGYENHENRCPPLFSLCYRHVRWYIFESSLQCCRVLGWCSSPLTVRISWKCFFFVFCHCLLVQIILSPNRILILDFSLCNVNCAVTGLQEDESTDGWVCVCVCGRGIAKMEKNSWGWINGKNPLYELTNVLPG